ncbi:20898_t:CDS:1, partial [Gigaspora margarita]
MRGSFSDMFIRDTINWVDRSSPPGSPVLEPEKDKVPAPTQGNSSVSEYIKMIKLYAISIGKNLDDIDVKEKFLVGLSPDNEKHVEEFGIKKPLSEIFDFLVEFC